MCVYLQKLESSVPCMWFYVLLDVDLQVRGLVQGLLCPHYGPDWPGSVLVVHRATQELFSWSPVGLVSLCQGAQAQGLEKQWCRCAGITKTLQVGPTLPRQGGLEFDKVMTGRFKKTNSTRLSADLEPCLFTSSCTPCSWV